LADGGRNVLPGRKSGRRGRLKRAWRRTSLVTQLVDQFALPGNELIARNDALCCLFPALQCCKTRWPRHADPSL
jgi:hypothetical protein